MKQNRLGGTDLRVSEVGLGTTGIGGHNLFVNLDEVDSVAAIFQSLDMGINFFDTADFYGLGRTEQLLGKTLPPNAIVATKGGLRWDQDGKFTGRDISPAYIRSALESSLKRLKRDTIDLYYLHAPDGNTPIAEAFAELHRLREQGKIRYAGLSNVSLAEIEAAAQAGPVAAVQNQFSLFDRRPQKKGLLDYCEAHGVAFVPYGALAFGILGGKYRRDFRLPAADWRNRVALFDRRNYPAVILAAHRLRDFADRTGVPLTHIALRWVLQQPTLVTTITGAKRPGQVEENAGVSGFTLTDGELKQIQDIIGDLRIHWPRKPFG
jgi:myo-inositol catabolism protein IolS